jgi:hypothetical protein
MCPSSHKNIFNVANDVNACLGVDHWCEKGYAFLAISIGFAKKKD